jgi:hypothetical protein
VIDMFFQNIVKRKEKIGGRRLGDAGVETVPPPLPTAI